MGNIVRISALAILLFCITNTYAEVNTTGFTVDSNGDIVVIGYCLGNVRIAGQEYTITQPSVYILKLNPDGEMIWVKFANSTGSIAGNAVAVDSSGNIYLTGEFSGVINFDGYNLTAQGTDAFIVKYNFDGEVNWVKHGTSPGTARGNDIFVKNNLVFVCGFGETITFDSLYTAGEGFTVIYNTAGNVSNLFKTGDIAHKLTVDANNDIIIYLRVYFMGGYTSRISKFSSSGNLIWGIISNYNHSFCVDDDDNIFSLSGWAEVGIFLEKFNSAGYLLNSTSFGLDGSSHLGKDIILLNQNKLSFCGYYSSGFQFGDSVLQSNGSTDFFLAVVDSHFNPVWIKHGGSVNEDELNSILSLNDGNIICNGNFRGAITLDTIQITGGISSNDKWVGIVKYGIDGNLIWVKKLIENYTVPTTVDWFPLEVGDKFQYFKKYNSYWGDEYGDYSIRLFQVTDSVWLNNNKYYSVDGFYWFNSGTKIRYDQESQQILVVYNNQEYPFMDFSKLPGETFQQTNGAGGYYNATIISQNLVILEDSIEVKGFYIVRRFGGGGWPPLPYGDLVTSIYFAPEIGWVFQDEENYITSIPKTDLFLIEHLIFKDGLSIHKKHTETATLIFQPVTFISEGDSLYQDFIIHHPFSKQNVPASHGYFSYTTAYLQSFYFNGSDTLWNSEFQIPQTTEKDFTLNYQFDTTKYEQGYHLYYRIAAVDKGIIPDTFYSPTTGYYKLYWIDSTTSVTQISPEVFDYSLSQNYPNPFNPNSKISFSIPEREFVSLKVFDILGSEITTLVNEEFDAGKYEVDFDGSKLSSGIYIYRITSGNYTSTKKMILMK